MSMKLPKVRVAGAVLAVLLVFSFVGPAATAKSPAASLGPSAVAQVSSIQEEEISPEKQALRELAGSAVISLFSVSPEMKATKPAFPYKPLEAVFDVVVPPIALLLGMMPVVCVPVLEMLKPIEPVLTLLIDNWEAISTPIFGTLARPMPPLAPTCTVLPPFCGGLLGAVRGVLACPELFYWLMPMVADVLEGYSIIFILDLALNPLSLAALNPTTWADDPTLQALCRGFEPEHLLLCGIPFIPSCLENVGVLGAVMISGLAVVTGAENLLGIAAEAT